MTDPIRIPVDGSHGAQDAWQHTLTITPDLARRIVALAGIRVCDIADDDEESAEPWDVRARSDAWCAVVKTLERHGEVLINQPEPNGVLAACGIIDRMIMKRNRLEGKIAKAEDERDQALADLAAMAKRAERAETEAAACNDLCSEIDADSPAECIREVRRMRRDLERLEDERDKAERDANHYQTDLHVHVGYLRDAEAQRDRLAKLLRIVAGRHEHGQPIPSREIAAALAELGKKP